MWDAAWDDADDFADDVILDAVVWTFDGSTRRVGRGWSEALP